MNKILLLLLTCTSLLADSIPRPEGLTAIWGDHGIQISFVNSWFAPVVEIQRLRDGKKDQRYTLSRDQFGRTQIVGKSEYLTWTDDQVAINVGVYEYRVRFVSGQHKSPWSKTVQETNKPAIPSEPSNLFPPVLP